PELGGARRSLSFLTEDGTEGSGSEDGAEAGPLSSTRRSLLEELELELGGGCGSGDPPPWWVCPPESPSLSIPSLAPWPPAHPALPPQPLASSTLLSAGAELGEGPRSRAAGGRMGGPPQALPKPPRDPTVLLVPGDHGHPHNSLSNARGSPGASPTVLLVPGDHGHPHNSLSNARGSPGASPMVLLVPGDHGHPPDSPSDAQGSLCATSSPNPKQRSPAVPLLPAGCSTRRSKEHLEDEERGQAPTTWHSPGTEATTSPKDTVVQDGRACTLPPRPLSDEALRRRLRVLGDDPGPVTELTRRLPELAAALRTGDVPDCAQDELALAQQFDRPDRSRRWREGLVKSSFNYLLLDPRTTQNLPLRSHHLSPAECFRTFVKAIFYVGKGTRARPYCHLAEALSQHRAGTQKGCPKVRRILEIWASGQGIISVHCFQSTVPAEAYTRESCLVEALGLQTITNQRKGNCYGVAASWPAARRRRLGVHMLHRAMRIFLAEGERQLRPADI
ncbi:ANKL1 protein, partial [Pluvianellus socialis]|nr:ANKL1 protein [Pluvianellus socialis]